MIRIEVEEIAVVEQLAARRDDISALVDRAARDNLPTVDPAFLVPWLHHAERTGQAPCVLLAWRGTTLVGVVPLVRPKWRFGLGGKALQFPQLGTTPPFDVVAMPELVEEFVIAVGDFLMDRGDWDFIWLHETPAESPASAALRRHAAARGARIRLRQASSYYSVPLAMPWQDFSHGLSSKFKQNLRRGWRACQQLGDTQVLVYPDNSQCLTVAVSMMREVIDRSWKTSAHDAQELLAALVRSLGDAGKLRLSFLLVDGRPLAYLLEAVHGGRAFAIHNAYDLRHQRLSLGQLMFESAIRAAAERGDSRYEFLGNREYLGRWTAERRIFDETMIVNARVASRFKEWLQRQRLKHRTVKRSRLSEHKKNLSKNSFRAQEYNDID